MKKKSIICGPGVVNPNADEDNSEGYKKLMKMAKEGDVGARELCDGMVELYEMCFGENKNKRYYYNDHP